MLAVKFFVKDGEVFGLNHSPKPGQKLIMPIRECNQFKQYQEIMLSAESDLKGKSDGTWTFNPTTKWQHSPLSMAEQNELY